MSPPPFSADSPMVTELRPSPRHETRRGRGVVDTLVLHYTGLPTLEDALAHLTGPQGEVSCHYVVDVDGRVLQLVPESLRAWHAGVSAWAGETDINSCSIGVEIVNCGHDAGYPDFPEMQIAATIALCRDIVERHRLRPDRVLGHSDVAPQRKRDPGEKFPWQALALGGVGLWVPPAPILDDVPALARGARNPPVGALKALLAFYGYELAVDDQFDDATEAVVTAFQRHFRPARVDGVADLSTAMTLRDLLAARDCTKAAAI